MYLVSEEILIVKEKLGFLGVLPVLLSALSGCGSPIAATPVSGSALTGNWNIVGSASTNVFTSGPSLSFSLVADGQQLYANGTFRFACDTPSTIGGGGSIILIGSIAADGSFTLTAPSGYNITTNGSPILVTVTGKVPPAGATGWSGTYSIVNSAGTMGCVTNETGAFTATAYAPLTGTYAGSVAANSGIVGPNINLSLVQGQPIENGRTSSGGDYLLPLTGHVLVSGISCFTNGATPTPLSGQVDGNFVSVILQMNDGSTMFINGELASTDSSTIRNVGIGVMGGQCNGSYIGTLTQQ